MIAGDSPRSPAADPRRDRRQARARADRDPSAARRAPGPADRPRLPVHALRAGPVRRPRHSGDHADDRRRAAARGVHRPARDARHGPARRELGRAAQELVGSLDQGLELAQGTTSFVWAGRPDRPRLGDRARADRPARPLPRRRRRPLRALPAARDRAAPRRAQPAQPARLLALRRARLHAFRVLGAWPRRRAAPAEPGSGHVGRLARARAARVSASSVSPAGSSRGTGSSRGGRSARTSSSRARRSALLALGIVALLVLATNPFALLFVLPALHAWLWLPQVRSGPAPARALALPRRARRARCCSSARSRVRFGLGFDAPWYLLELVAVGYVHVPAVAIALAALRARRSSPPSRPAATRRTPRRANGPPGPLRELVRTSRARGACPAARDRRSAAARSA